MDPAQHQQVVELQSYLYTLYHASSTTIRDEANRWLHDWQSNPAAWPLVHDILSGRAALSTIPPSSDAEVYYFCAQTLRTKITRDFEELDASMRAALPGSVLAMLARHQAVSFIRTQLSLGMAMLGMHIPGSAWRELDASSSSMIEWVSKRLFGEPTMRHVLLEILTVVPQEAMAYQPSLLPARRREIEREMRVAGLPKALEVLEALAGDGNAMGAMGAMGAMSANNNNKGMDGENTKHVLEALAAWLRLGGSPMPGDAGGAASSGASMDPSTYLTSSLIPLAINSLQKEEGPFYAAVDAVIEIIFCSSAQGRPKPELAGLVQAMVAQVMGLLPQFHVCIQKAMNERDHDDVYDGDHAEQAKALARLFAEVGEAYADLICEATPEVMGPVEALLDVCRYPEMEVASISFNFWHRVSFTLSAGKRPHGLNWEGAVLPEAEAERRIAAFRGYFERLVETLTEKTRYPEESEHWHSDEKNDFKYTRQAVSDLLLDATDVVGPDACIQLAIKPLSEVSATMNAGGAFDWRKAEASVYCLRSVHRASNDVRDGATLMSVLSSLSYLPSQPTLDYSVVLVLGAYSDWLAREAERDASGGVVGLIHQLIELIVRGLGNDHTSAACALSLRNMCESCGKFLVAGANGPAFVEQMLELYRQAQTHGDVSGESTAAGGVTSSSSPSPLSLLSPLSPLSSTVLDEEDVEHILEAIAMVIKHLPSDVKRAHVQHMIESVVRPIQGALERGAAPNTMMVALPLFERITTILRNVDDVEDVAATLERMLPLIEVAFNLFGADPEACERICRLPRYAVRTAKRSTVSSLPALANMLMVQFERTMYSSYLYVASELVKTFGDDPSQDACTQPLLSRMLMSACSILGSLQTVSAQPNLTDDTFLLAGRGLSYAPRLVVSSQQLLVALIETARNAILVQHREACASVAGFLVRLLDPSTHRHCDVAGVKMLEAVFTPYAGILTQLVIAGGVGALPASRIHEMADVLYALLKSSSNGQESVGRVQAALARVPDSALPASDKGRFLQLCGVIVGDQILEDDEQQLVDALVDLSECCRRHKKVQAVVMESLLDVEFRVFN